MSALVTLVPQTFIFPPAVLSLLPPHLPPSVLRVEVVRFCLSTLSELSAFISTQAFLATISKVFVCLSVCLIDPRNNWGADIYKYLCTFLWYCTSSLSLYPQHIQCTVWKAWTFVPGVPAGMVERDDMPGVAADSCSLRNVCVATGNGWVVQKCCVIIMPFAAYNRWLWVSRSGLYVMTQTTPSCFFSCAVSVVME